MAMLRNLFNHSNLPKSKSDDLEHLALGFQLLSMNYLYKTCLKEKAIAATMPGCMFGGRFMPDRVCPKQWEEYNQAKKDCEDIKEAMMSLQPKQPHP